MSAFAPIASLPVASVPGGTVVVVFAKPSDKLLKQLLYRRRFTSKWHKGGKPRPKNRRFVWQKNLANARVTWIGQEVANKGDATQNVRVTWSAMEVANQGDQVQRVRVTWTGLEVICSLQGLDDGILTLIL